MLQISKFIFNSFSENTYILWDEENLDTAIIDPGCNNSLEEQSLKKFIEANKLKPKYLISTHCHIDHIFGNAFIKEEYQTKYLAGKEDNHYLEIQSLEASQFGIEMKNSPFPDEHLSENTILKLGNSSLEFLFTPGHTPGEYCIYCPKEEFCLTGDVLFAGTIGRTDFWGGDFDTLMKSIKEKLLVLPEQTVIYPGHGRESTIGTEKRYNQFFN